MIFASAILLKLNRVTAAWSAGPQWGETFTIDPWGNLSNRASVGGKTNYEGLSAAALSNNRLSGFGYDAAGNMIANGGANFTYDAENRLLTAGGVTYTYDADGQRVKKSSGTLYWNGLGSETLSESDLTGAVQSEYIYFNGKRVARRDVPGSPTAKYYFSDELGSASVITNATGVMPPLKESDYYPYGGEIPISGSDPNHYKFNGKERDTESGLDNFGARFDASTLGRFMTPDWAVKPTTVPYANFGNPQSLNLYSYVTNNPTTLGDPDGHCEVEGKEHGRLWCSLHSLGFIQTPKEVEKDQNDNANRLRRIFKDRGVVIRRHGKVVNPNQLSDQEVLQDGQQYFEALLSGDVGTISPLVAATIITPKIVKQMSPRGWSESLIDDTIDNPSARRSAMNKETGQDATAYFRSDGSYVVRDNSTGEILQVSDRTKSNWIPDSTIQDPYKP